MSSLGATASDGDGRLVVSGGGDDGVVDQQVSSIEQLTASLQREKLAKRKMYGYLVKIADELKALRNESEQLIHAAEYAQRAWHEGGMWRGPNVLPDAASSGLHNNSGGGGGGSAAGAGAGSTGPALVPRAPLSLTDLFVDIVTVTSFLRVGAAIQDRGTIDTPVLAYFAVFWLIWKKEESYSTRFDTTDISSHLMTLSVCFALLSGSLSAYSTLDSGGCTRIMGVAMFVALLHAALYIRVWCWFHNTEDGNTVNLLVKKYAINNTIMNTLEAVTYGVGIALHNHPNGGDWRKYIFLGGIILNIRLPGAIMPNDFHTACRKRGVLFILLLGFNLQSILTTASPFFNYWEPSFTQYAFLFLECLLLFMIKLLYVDDTYAITPHDHALLYNHAAGFFFNFGNFTLLLFTTILGSGLNLLTHSYLAAAASLPNDAKNLVCGGMSLVFFSILFIKCMHIRRVPTNPKHEQLFLIAYFTQVAGVLTIVYITARMYFLPTSGGEEEIEGFLALLMRNEIQMLFVLVVFALILLILSYLDEALELQLYSDASEASENRVRPFGIWACCQYNEPLQLEAMALERNRLAKRSMNPLLGASVMSFSGSMNGMSMYNSFANFDSLQRNEDK